MSEEVYFTADTHFFHRNIVWLGKGRPFDTVEEMNEALIERWNERVRPSDRVYHLGDFSFGGKEATERVIRSLNGRLHVVRGNHDKVLDPLGGLFESYQQYKEIKMGKQRLVLFHFPIESWHQVGKGAWHLHGHCHGNLAEAKDMARMDVGVDPNRFAPVSYDEVAEKLMGRSGVPSDHHGITVETGGAVDDKFKQVSDRTHP